MTDNESLNPKHVRAARALLAWKQSDLAQAASVATSTIADFERGRRTPVANNVSAMKAALEAKGISFLPGGVSINSRLAVPKPPQPGRPMRWIEARDLAHWGASRDGQGTLPELAARLILAEYGPAAAIRFPSDDSVQHAGWDGVCVAPGNTTYIPAGQSAWEMGGQRSRIAKKAQDDYDKRTQNPLGIVPSQACFIFFTPQRWPQKEGWAAERRAEGKWRDVRVIDGDTLVHWLELYPGVAEWLAVRINRRPEGLRSVSATWREWSLAADPPLSPSLMLADRDDQAMSILKWLAAKPSVLSVQAENSDEAIAFLHAAVSQLPTNHQIFWASRILVAASDDVARELIGVGPKMVVVLNGGEPGIAAALVKDGHHVYAAFGSDTGSPRDVMRLPRPWRQSVEQELETMGLPALDARRIARQCGRSLTVLRRILTQTPAQRPSWSRPPIGSGLIAAMLAGAWRQDHPADRKVLERLSGLSYAQLEAELAPLAASFDGPLRKSGSVWKLASLRDAWHLIGGSLTTEHLEKLEAAFLEVLGTPSPDFDTDQTDPWKFDRAPPTQPSKELRNGLSEAVIALGVYPEQVSCVPDGGQRAARIVRSLLVGADEQLWWSLSDDFRSLAEAAPEQFLRCVEEALDKEPSPLAPLFRSDEGFLLPREYLADLLWAIELLCWSPKHLLAGTSLLARLAEMDPGGHLDNRPHRSLTQILLPWAPETFATAQQRLQVMDAITRRFDRVGWALLVSLAPTPHGISHRSAMPHWRDFSNAEPEPVTRKSLAQTYGAIGTRLLDKAGSDAGRWIALLALWPNFNSSWRAHGEQRLAKAVVSFSEDERLRLRKELRDLIDHHEAFSNAPWAMDAATLSPLKAILRSLEPRDLRARHAWLFNRGNHQFRGGTTVSFDDARAALLADQRAAVEALAAAYSPSELIEYAQNLELPGSFGDALVAGSISASVKDELVDLALTHEDSASIELAQRMIMALGAQRGIEWLWNRFDRAARGPNARREALPFAQALPQVQDTWNRIASTSEEVEQEYWRNIYGFSIPKEQDFHFVVDRYLWAGRAHDALTLIAVRRDVKVPSMDVLRVLRDPSIFRGSPIPPHYVEWLFQRLDTDSTLSEEEFVRLEWSYYSALEGSQRPPRTLEGALAKSPQFFVELVSAVFSSKDEVPPENPEMLEGARKVARQAFNVLEKWTRIPGSDEAGKIDPVALEKWVNEARRLCADCGRAEVGDDRIGRILSAAPRVTGQPWPPEPIRDVIEQCRSRDLEQGFELGAFNRRGVSVRAPTDGGQQERDLAALYRSDAQACAFTWQRTSALLERLADMYTHDATREDQGAEQRDWS
jgi:DNA-binding XRE family transcriptional regulator